MLSLEDLIAIEEIKQLKARYFRCVDTMDIEGFLETFTADASMVFDLDTPDVGEPTQLKINGRKELREYFDRAWHGKQIIWSAHYGTSAEIDVLSDTEARGLWAMEDIVDMRDSDYHGYGHYREIYRKTDGKWRIQTLHLTRTRVINTPKVRARG